jgi:hypothetical protein
LPGGIFSSKIETSYAQDTCSKFSFDPHQSDSQAETQQMQSYNIHHVRLPLLHANRKELREVYLECDETYASELPSIRKCHAIQLFNRATLRKEVTDIIFC